MKRRFELINSKVVIILFIFLLLRIGLRKIDKFQDYDYTVIVNSHSFADKNDKELYKGEKIYGEFESHNNNLGIVAVRFNTHSRINNDYLQFSLREKGQTNWFYTNKYKADQFQDRKYFPFGFPEIKDSKGKTYEIQIESLSGIEGDSIQVMMKNSELLSKYSFPKKYLLENRKEIIVFLFSKCRSFLGNIALIDYICIIFVSLLEGFLYKFVNLKKIRIFMRKLYKNSPKNTDLFFKKNINVRLVRGFLFIFCLVILFLINHWINGPIRLKAISYADDLWNLSFFNENKDNYLALIFNISANKFRPVFNFVFFGLFYLFENATWFFGYFNLIFIFFISCLLFHLFRKISKSTIVSLLLSSIFIFSRFAYYNIAQVLGVMESMALLFSILIFYFLWIFFKVNDKKYFWISLVMFTLLIFTHERFIVFLGIYFIVFLFLGFKKENILLFIYSTIPVILNFLIRFCFFGGRILDGTGGTSILDTFNFFVFKSFFFSGWLYLFGINDGPAVLNGISKEAVPFEINVFIRIGIICLFLILILFWLFVLSDKKKNVEKYKFSFVLFFSFVTFSLIGAAVTIRLEMRWLYVPFVGLLFLLAFLFGVMKQRGIFYKYTLIILLVWTIVSGATEIFYRSNFGEIYFWNTQAFGNSFYEATIEKYGRDFLNYKTYVVCGDKTIPFILSCVDYGDSQFFKQYKDRQKFANIILVDDVSKIELDDEKQKILILMYDRQERKFIELKIGCN